MDVTAHLGDEEREALFAALEHDDRTAAGALLDVAEERAGRTAEASGDGNEGELRQYWLTGPGGRRIRWRTNGAWRRCVEEVSATGAATGLTDIKAYCAELYHEARGEWPGKAGRTGKKPATKKIDYVRRQPKAPAGGKGGTVTSEAHIDGRRSYDDTRMLVGNALRARLAEQPGESYAYASVADLTDSQVVYSVYSRDDPDALWQCSYTIDGAGTVALGAPARVVRTYAQSITESAAAAEAHTELGRVLEARGEGDDGGRRYAVQVIRAGDSKNHRRYPAAVLEAAAPLYEGAQVYDGHRSDDQMRSSAIGGLVGYLTGVVATSAGLEAELSLLPSAGRVAEAFDAALELDGQRADPFVGLSHDVMARFRGLTEGGQTVHEATEITAVNSVDVVAVPAAGGRATRVLAGGGPITPTDDPAPGGGSTQEEDVPVTKADVLGVLKEATDDELSAVGLARAGTTTTEAVEPEKPAPPTETVSRDGVLGRFMIRQAAEAAQLPATMVDRLTAALPPSICEADVTSQVGLIKDIIAAAEPIPAGVGPTASVGRESVEKKTDAVFAMLDPSGRADGYISLKEAWADFTGARVLSWGEDINQRIMRESHGGGYDSHGRVGASAARRSTESLDSTSWAQVLGDSITRQAIALYSQPELQSWQKIVSTFGAPMDFRQQRRVRIGGYGLLPTVSEGQPYQPLQSPGDEEAVYSVIKRGGTEDLTMETIVNDDIGKVREIPRRLGLAAAITIYRYVWDMLKDNATCTYDSTALFHTDHANTDTASALTTGTLAVARRKMREQSAYNDTLNLLSVANVPKLLVVPNELEVLAWQIANSAVQLPSAAPVGAASDVPNIHRGLDVEVIDYWTDADDWFAIANSGNVPLIEVGFLQGRREPELFTQSDPTQGASFDADISVTYKLRHIYAGTVLDHRGFYRGQG